MNPARILRIAVPLAIALAVYLIAYHWAPERQVARRQAAFVGAIDGADHGTYSRLISPSYSDRWGFTHDSAIQGIRDLSRHFLSLQADYSPASLVAEGETWVATGQLKLGGQGNAIAQEAVARANRLTEPFTFSWQKESWKPWDWQLVQIDHPNLHVPSSYTRGAAFDIY
ncbi:hypothetical protein BH23VER1_BH23VER1_37250 [soil metagenome]